MQKCFTVDYLTKKMKPNEGEVPQYYVENSHPAIIDPVEWDMVQVEILRRKAMRGKYSGNSVFASRIVCGDCGGFYGQKVWHSTDSYRKVIWRCNNKFDGKKCETPHLDAETIQQKFLIAYDRLMSDRDNVIVDCELMRQALPDCSALDTEITELGKEVEIVAGLVDACVKENASYAQSQEYKC